MIEAALPERSDDSNPAERERHSGLRQYLNDEPKMLEKFGADTDILLSDIH